MEAVLRTAVRVVMEPALGLILLGELVRAERVGERRAVRIVGR